MSCIIGAKCPETGAIWLAGDSQGLSGWDRVSGGPATESLKYFLCRNYLAAATGSIRVSQMIQYKADSFPKILKVVDIHQFVETFHTLFRESGWSRVLGRGEDFDYRISLLIATEKFLWAIAGSGAILTGPVLAIGCGKDYALGAFHANPGLSIGLRLSTAVETAIHFNTACGGDVWNVNATEFLAAKEEKENKP